MVLYQGQGQSNGQLMDSGFEHVVTYSVSLLLNVYRRELVYSLLLTIVGKVKRCNDIERTLSLARHPKLNRAEPNISVRGSCQSKRENEP